MLLPKDNPCSRCPVTPTRSERSRCAPAPPAGDWNRQSVYGRCDLSPPDRGRDVGFLDVHVEQIGQQFDIAQSLHERDAVFDRAKQVGFVAVQWLISTGTPCVREWLPSSSKESREQCERGWLVGSISPATLHGTNDGRRVERTRQINDRLDEVDRLLADR